MVYMPGRDRLLWNHKGLETRFPYSRHRVQHPHDCAIEGTARWSPSIAAAPTSQQLSGKLVTNHSMGRWHRLAAALSFCVSIGQPDAAGNVGDSQDVSQFWVAIELQCWQNWSHFAVSRNRCSNLQKSEVHRWLWSDWHSGLWAFTPRHQVHALRHCDGPKLRYSAGPAVQAWQGLGGIPQHEQDNLFEPQVGNPPSVEIAWDACLAHSLLWLWRMASFVYQTICFRFLSHCKVATTDCRRRILESRTGDRCWISSQMAPSTFSGSTCQTWAIVPVAIAKAWAASSVGEYHCRGWVL